MDRFNEILKPSILFESPNDKGSDGGDPKSRSQQEDNPAPNPLPEHAIKGLNNLINRTGGESEAVKLLYDDNFQLREKIRNIENQLPGDETVVLNDEDAKAWNEYKNLGKPDELKTSLEKQKELSQKVSSIERTEKLKSIAEGQGYNYKALEKLAGDDIDFETEKHTVDGKQVDVVMVVHGEGDNKTKTRLSDYAEQNWKDFMPVLTSDSDKQSQTDKRISYPGQKSATNTEGPRNIIDERINRNRQKAGYKVAET